MADRFPKQAESDLIYLVDQKNGDRMLKQLLNSVITKYRDLSVSRRSIMCRQIIDLLATDKSRYFAQPRSIIVNYYPTSLCRVQITPKTSTNITRYLYSRGPVWQVFSQRASDEFDSSYEKKFCLSNRNFFSTFFLDRNLKVKNLN